jgi:hypothetical protein
VSQGCWAGPEAVDAAVRGFLLLREQTLAERGPNNLLVRTQLRRPERIQVHVTEPNRIAGIWGALMGNYRVTYGDGNLKLRAEFDGLPGLEVSFRQSSGTAPPVRQEFIVLDLEEATTTLDRLGCRQMNERKNQVTVVDPEGNLLALIQATSD